MPITYRHEKGAPLTVQEIDGNFKELETRLKTLEENKEEGEGIEKIHLEGDQLTFTGTFGKDFGTFTLPKLNLNSCEPWSPQILSFPQAQSQPSSLPLYEKASLPETANLGQLALLLEEEEATLVFFNGKNWQRLMKGESL